MDREYEQYGPFGCHGDDIGGRAIGVLAGFSEAVPDEYVSPDGRLFIWSEDDFRTFQDLEQLESGIRFIEPHPEIDGGDIGDLHRALGRFHAALPFNEAERQWLFDPVDVREPMQPAKRANIFDIDNLVGVVEEVTSAGLKQVIQGREIVRRMATWRRETNEFAAQGTLDEARQELGIIATTLVRDENWPREHEDLRVKLREAV